MLDREVTIRAVFSAVLSRCAPGASHFAAQSQTTHCSWCQLRVDRCLFGPINKNTLVPVVRDFRSGSKQLKVSCVCKALFSLGLSWWWTSQPVNQMVQINRNKMNKSYSDSASLARFYSLQPMRAWKTYHSCHGFGSVLSHRRQAADLHQRVTGDNSRDRSVLVYDFGTFTLKPSSTGAFKLWQKTSLGREHLISPQL